MTIPMIKNILYLFINGCLFGHRYKRSYVLDSEGGMYVCIRCGDRYNMPPEPWDDET